MFLGRLKSDTSFWIPRRRLGGTVRGGALDWIPRIPGPVVCSFPVTSLGEKV